MADVPWQSFGYKKEWKCKTIDEFLTLFDRLFPLPQQCSWQSFRLSSKIVTRITDALQMKQFDVLEWKKLPRIGTSISRPGASSCNLGELTRTWDKRSNPRQRDSQMEIGSSLPSFSCSESGNTRLKEKRTKRLLKPNATDEEIMSADGAGACIHQQHNKDRYFSPVRALRRRHCHI